MRKQGSSFGYSQVPRDDVLAESRPSSPIVSSAWSKQSRFWIFLPWAMVIISGCANLVLGGLLYTALDRESEIGSFSAGFRTEFATAREHIEVVETSFNGAPSFRADGTAYVPNPDPVRYVGHPRQYPEVDENWEKLIAGRYIRITEKEASEAFGDDYKDYWNYQAGGYVTGLDMFHTLHCVNHLRRGYYPEVYTDENPKFRAAETIELHRNHCLEQLRQYIMCHGDLTPLPTKYFQQIDRQYVLSDIPHTCRNFEKIQTWMMDRYEGESAVHSIWYQNKTDNSS